MAEPIISFDHVRKYFRIDNGMFQKRNLRAVEDVSFSVEKGEILAIVGESGCGKSTMARMLCRLYAPTAGKITVDGEDITALNHKKAKEYTSKVQMIYQDPFSSLNPAHTNKYIIGRAVELHQPGIHKEEVRKKTVSLFESVGLTPAEDYMNKHPSHLSGGQRQRIVIARALAMEPDIIVADEPTSMLDVSISIDIMNLMIRLQKEKNLTYLFITHNLASARYMANRIAVMYAGSCVELGDIDDVIEHPLHPYTVLLLNSIPEPFRIEKIDIQASEKRPDLTSGKQMCKFAARCPLAEKRCFCETPGDYCAGNHRVKCFLYENSTEGQRSKVDVSIYTRKAGLK